MKRILMLLALTATAILATATVAQAQNVTNTMVSFGYAGWVRCANGGAGELVTGTIELHDLVTSTVNEDVDASQYMSAPRGSLVGQITGDTYRLSGVARGTYIELLQSDRYVATYINRYRLIGPGTGNDLAVRETTHITRDGDDVVVRHDDFAIECA